jgi:hypothetical protein
MIMACLMVLKYGKFSKEDDIHDHISQKQKKNVKRKQ